MHTLAPGDRIRKLQKHVLQLHLTWDHCTPHLLHSWKIDFVLSVLTVRFFCVFLPWKGQATSTSFATLTCWYAALWLLKSGKACLWQVPILHLVPVGVDKADLCHDRISWLDVSFERHIGQLDFVSRIWCPQCSICTGEAPRNKLDTFWSCLVFNLFLDTGFHQQNVDWAKRLYYKW